MNITQSTLNMNNNETSFKMLKFKPFRLSPKASLDIKNNPEVKQLTKFLEENNADLLITDSHRYTFDLPSKLVLTLVMYAQKGRKQVRVYREDLKENILDTFNAKEVIEKIKNGEIDLSVLKS